MWGAHNLSSLSSVQYWSMLVTTSTAALCIASHADVCRGPVLYFLQGGGETLVNSENDCVRGKSIYNPRDEEIEVLWCGMTARGMTARGAVRGVTRCELWRHTDDKLLVIWHGNEWRDIRFCDLHRISNFCFLIMFYLFSGFSGSK